MQSARYSSDPADLRKFDPRTEEVKRILTPWKEKQELRQKSIFNFLRSRANITDILKLLQTPFDFRSTKVKSWWNKKIFLKEVSLQEFDKDRLYAVGSDIAAGHAFLPLGVGLQYKGKPWLKLSEGSQVSDELPNEYESGWVLEAIDFSGTRIRYEGLINLRNLNRVHTLIAKKCPYLDDWCLDMISSELLALETIDLSGCEKISSNGLVTLTRLPKLHTLDLSDCPVSDNKDGMLVCLLLQDYNPNLNIRGVTFSESTVKELPIL